MRPLTVELAHFHCISLQMLDDVPVCGSRQVCAACRKTGATPKRKRAGRPKTKRALVGVAAKKPRQSQDPDVPPSACQRCNQNFGDDFVAFPRPQRWRASCGDLVGAPRDISWCCAGCWRDMIQKGEALYKKSYRQSHGSTIEVHYCP